MNTATLKEDPTFLGIDFGTSGARCFVIDTDGNPLESSSTSYSSSKPEDLGETWRTALFTLIDTIHLKSRIASIAIDGTSSTTLLLDSESGDLLAPPKLYNEAQAPQIVSVVKAMAPPNHTTTSSTSTLCKVLAFTPIWQTAMASGKTPLILHQADWLSSLLHGHRGITDWNNALKLGYDPGMKAYEEFLLYRDFTSILPSMVCAPGHPVASITSDIANSTGLPESCIVCGGTTDSIAAFLAAGVTSPGQAVVSLGSTLAIKMLSETRVDDASYGIYSHRLGDSWLVGGASNTGGAVLRQFFNDEQLLALTPRMDANKPTGLKYTVLPSKGERFPINDPDLEPCMEPRPEDDAVFLQALLEGMAATEADAFKKLAELGATPVEEVYTAGGGSKNPVWTELRRRALGVPVVAAENGEAAYGSALLAKQGYEIMIKESSGTALLM